jgi:hypothetical protein
MSTRHHPTNWTIAAGTLLLSFLLSPSGHAQSLEAQSVSTPNRSIESTPLANRFPATIAIARNTTPAEPALSALVTELRELDISSLEERVARDELIKQIAIGSKQCPTCNQVVPGATGGPRIGSRPRTPPATPTHTYVPTSCPNQDLCPEGRPLFDTRDNTCKAAKDL